MNDLEIKALVSRIYRSTVNYKTTQAESAYMALMSSIQRYLSHSNSGNAIPARDEWLTVRILAFEVYNLEQGGVIEIVEFTEGVQ